MAPADTRNAKVLKTTIFNFSKQNIYGSLGSQQRRFFVTISFSSSQHFSLWWETEHIGPTLSDLSLFIIQQITAYRLLQSLFVPLTHTSSNTFQCECYARSPQNETFKQGKMNKSYYHSILMWPRNWELKRCWQWELKILQSEGL